MMVFDNTTTERMIAALGSACDGVRYWVTCALRGRDNVPHEVFVKLMNDPSKSVRIAAVQAFTSREDLPALANALEDEDEQVRWEAAGCLKQITKKMGSQQPHETKLLKEIALRHLEDDCQYVRNDLQEVLRVLGLGEDATRLLNRLGNMDARERLRAAQALARLGYPEGMEHLRELLGPESPVRIEAIHSIMSLSQKDGVKLIFPLLKDESREVRLATIHALANSETTEEVVSALVDLLECPDDTIAEAAAQSLSYFHTIY